MNLAGLPSGKFDFTLTARRAPLQQAVKVTYGLGTRCSEPRRLSRSSNHVQSMPSRPKLALVGLPSHHPMVPENVRDLVKEQLSKVNETMEAAGYDSNFIPVTPDATHESLTSTFAAEPYDGIIVGFGIRGIPANTPFFEQVVAAIRAGAPNAKMLFNTSPESTVDAARRGFPLET